MVTQNKVQVEAYVSQVTTELRSLDMLNHDWGHVLNSAPVAIGILGECMIVASMRKASFIQLEGPNLAISLPANIMKAAQVGTTTFVEAHTRMNEIAMHAENVGRKGGTIDKIIDRVEGKDSPAARRMLTRQLALLQSAADVCTAEANEINKYFKTWQEFTNSLLHAMTIRKDATVMEQNERNEELMQEELVKETKVKELIRAERLLQEKKQQLADAGDELDNLSGTRGRKAISVGLSALHPVLGLSFMAGMVFEVMLAENQVELAYEYYEKQEKAAEDAKTATQELEAALKKIQQETCTLEEVIHVLFEAIKRLQSLQTEITALLLFFQTIAGRVRFLVQRLTKEFIDNVEDEDSRASHTYEEDLKNEIRETALPIKAQFMVIYQIAQVYSEVSFVYILDGLSLVNMLGLSHDSTSPVDMALKQHKLDRYKMLATEGVRSLTRKKRSEIAEGLGELVRDSARHVTGRS